MQDDPSEESANALREAKQVINKVSIGPSVRAKLLIQISDRYACLAAIERGLPGWPASGEQD